MRTLLVSFAVITWINLFAGSAGLRPGQAGFLPNQGQLHDQHRKPNPAVKYLLNRAGLNVQLKGDGFAYDTYVVDEMALNGEWEMMNGARLVPASEATYRFHRIDLRFVNGNANAEMIAEGKSADYQNYYTDVTGEAGAVFVHHFTRVTYKEVWPNIDVRCKATAEGFKYDVIVRPGGDVSNARFKVQGATIHENLKGRLVFTWADGELEELIPESWMVNGRRKSRVDARYDVGLDGTFGFRATTDATGTLVIDPFPTNPWATYSGGTGEEEALGVAMDGTSNTYITGKTTSTNGIATSGTHDATYSSNSDAFLMKYDAAGAKLWGTYCGGSGIDIAHAVACETGGIAAIAGQTSSNTAIGTVGAHQWSFAGGTSDAFIVRFNANGTRQWGSYLGGAVEDIAYSVALNDNGSSVICGRTTSTSGIASSGAADASHGGSNDAFVAQFTSTGTRAWGTYLGGSGYDWAQGVVFTGTYPVVCGTTSSSTGIATSGTHDTSLLGLFDAFAVRYSNTGAKLKGTYFGGEGEDYANGIAFNELDRMVIVGRTNSTTAIATAGAAQPTFLQGSQNVTDGFIACFNLSTFTRVWGTYCGGATHTGLGVEGLIAVAPTSSGGVAVMGTPFSTDLGTPDSWSPTGTDPAGPRPTFVAGYSSAGGKQWAGYPQLVKGRAIAGNATTVMMAGAGIQSSTHFDLPDSYQPDWGGGATDAYIGKLDLTESSAIRTLTHGHATAGAKMLLYEPALLVGSADPAIRSVMVRDACERSVLAIERPTAPLALSHHLPSGMYFITVIATDGTVRTQQYVVQ